MLVRVSPTVLRILGYGLKPWHLSEALKLVEEHADEFRSAWSKHFPG